MPTDLGVGYGRERTSASNWRKPLMWNKQAASKSTPALDFCASLADVFDNEVDEMWHHYLFRLIESTPSLTWLLLTKRIGNVIKMTDPMRGNPCLPQSVAIGATIANQDEYERDNFKLAEVKDKRGPPFTFGSFEHLLDYITLDD